MESISRLRETLINVISIGASPQVEQELFEELVLLKPTLVRIFNVGPRRPQEQRDVESGKAIVNGRSIAFNADYTRQVLFLARHFDCSELYVAGLLHAIMAENPNVGPVGCVEATVVEFHRRRRHLADCLRVLLAEALHAQAPHPDKIHVRLEEFVRRELIPGYEVAGGRVHLAQEILNQIEAIGTAICKVQSDRRNAGADTTIPSAQGSAGSLGYDILTARLDSLKYERRSLAIALFFIARPGHLRPLEIQRMVEWLSSNPAHSMTFHILSATLAALGTVDSKYLGGSARMKLAHDTSFITAMTKVFAPDTTWKDPALRATILLKWTLFLTESRHYDSSLEFRDSFKPEELEAQLWNAVQNGAFSYLALAVLQLQGQVGRSQISSLAGAIALSPEQQQAREIPDDESKSMILHGFENMVRSLIVFASSELRKIKQKQEDVVHTTARSDRARTLRSTTPFITSTRPGPDPERSAPSPPRHDIAILYSFIGLLYTALPPESALPFWGARPKLPASYALHPEYVEGSASKLPSFLQWAMWSTQARDIEMSTALYDMLTGLANGEQCSELAYNCLAKGTLDLLPGSIPTSNAAYGGGFTVSWNAIFNELESWAAAGVTKNPPVGPRPTFLMSSSLQNPASSPNRPWPQHPDKSPGHVALARSFLRLLATVVRHSVPVRLAITSNAQFRAIPTLVSLIPLGIPLELKGALFETLADFCTPGAGAPGIEICKAVWTLMERFEVINVRTPHAGGFIAPQSRLALGKGVEAELQDVESVFKMYPATIPFLKLLATLIHSPKRLKLADRVEEAEPINTIPETLGQPYRLPGIGPYVSFVVDTVFAKIPTREYLHPSDRWQTNDLCLGFIEQCIASYELESLQMLYDSAQLRESSTIPFLVHPGFDIMKRLLTTSPLQASILTYIVEGVEGFEKSFAREEPFFHSTILRVLRIVLRVLEVQDTFLDVLIPALAEFDSAPIIGTVYSRSYFIKFDQALSFKPQLIPALVSYVAFPSYPELVLLSIKITTELSQSHAFPNLLAFVERSSESERILDAFRQVVETETMEDVIASEDAARTYTGAGAPISALPQASLEQAIRLAALDLFIQDTGVGRPYPNIGHFLLFGDTVGIQDPHALGSRRTCIHVILDLVNHGIPRKQTKGGTRSLQYSSHLEPLFITLPALAERCYRIIYQLCMHPKTFEFSMRYLRTHEDFFSRQVAAIPAKVPETVAEPYIQVLYGDGSRVTTTVPALSSFLRLRSWILDLVALDLHILTKKGHHEGVADLLEILFGHNTAYPTRSEFWEDDHMGQFREMGQTHLRIIEFIQSLNFDWSDSLAVNPIDLNLLKNVDLQSCIRVDSTGCETVDESAVFSLLNSTRRALHSQGRIVTQAQVDQLRIEMNYIRDSCAVENHRRGVQYAVSTSYAAWRRLLDMTLAKCFHRLPHDRRENMLFDLLHVLPTTLRAPDVQPSTAVLLAEATVSLMTKLREDRRQQTILQVVSGDAEAGSLPTERLNHLLRSVLDCILDNSHIELVRGNLYAALINYLHLITSVDPGETKTRGALSISINSSLGKSVSVFNGPDSSGASKQASASLEASSLTIMKSSVERLVATVSRDAIDGSEVWKTVAFMCLDSLVRLSRSEDQQSILLALVRHGILSNFVTGLKDSDLRLQSILKPDPEELHDLYVYEAKMSLFIRMAQTRVGSERLLEAHILPVLARCDYLDARPDTDESFAHHHDSFLPSAIQRYHQLFIPALQVVEGMLSSLGSKHKTVSDQALQFLSSHRDTIVILFKTEVEPVPLPIIEEMHLLVSICGTVFPLVPPTEMASSHSGFGGVHTAIVALATRIFSGRSWSENVEPSTESEVVDASVYASGLEAETKFAVNVRRKERLLRKAIVKYLGTASQFTEPEIDVMLSPLTRTQRQVDRGPHLLPMVPTIGDAIAALDDWHDDLASTLRAIASLSAEIAAKDHVRVNDIQGLVNLPDLNFLQDLDHTQKRALIRRELNRILAVYKSDAQSLLNTTEMLLLLIWRHLQYYLGGQHVENLDMSASTARPARVSAVLDSDTFRAELWKMLTPVLRELEASLEIVGDELRSSRGYIEVMCRRLRDTIGPDALDSAQDGP